MLLELLLFLLIMTTKKRFPVSWPNIRSCTEKIIRKFYNFFFYHFQSPCPVSLHSELFKHVITSQKYNQSHSHFSRRAKATPVTLPNNTCCHMLLLQWHSKHPFQQTLQRKRQVPESQKFYYILWTLRCISSHKKISLTLP